MRRLAVAIGLVVGALVVATGAFGQGQQCPPGTTSSGPYCEAQGTRGPDRVTGTKANESFFMGAGNDRVSGGPGADKVSGGSGNDLLFVRDGSRDTVSCGAGDDGVSADRSDVVAGDCERVHRG